MQKRNSFIEYLLRVWLSVLAAGTVLLSSTGCAGSDKQGPAMSNGKIAAYNHTSDYIHQFYVDGAWGGNVYAYSGGSSFVCCVTYPRQWRSGLEVRVRWTTSSSDPNAKGDAATGVWHEAKIPIERYEQPGIVHVHFLSNGQVRLIVSKVGAGRPEYVGPLAPVKPKDFKW